MYGIKIRQTFFLENVQSAKLAEQLNSIAENLKQAASNEEVDTYITSFTSLVENVAKPFFQISKEDHNLQNVKSNFVYNEECEYKKIVFFNLLNKYRAEKSDANRMNMVRARTDCKAEVRKFKFEQDKAKT